MVNQDKSDEPTHEAVMQSPYNRILSICKKSEMNTKWEGDVEVFFVLDTLGYAMQHDSVIVFERVQETAAAGAEGSWLDTAWKQTWLDNHSLAFLPNNKIKLIHYEGEFWEHRFKIYRAAVEKWYVFERPLTDVEWRKTKIFLDWFSRHFYTTAEHETATIEELKNDFHDHMCMFPDNFAKFMGATRKDNYKVPEAASAGAVDEEAMANYDDNYFKTLYEVEEEKEDSYDQKVL